MRTLDPKAALIFYLRSRVLLIIRTSYGSKPRRSCREVVGHDSHLNQLGIRLQYTVMGSLPLSLRFALQNIWFDLAAQECYVVREWSFPSSFIYCSALDSLIIAHGLSSML